MFEGGNYAEVPLERLLLDVENCEFKLPKEKIMTIGKYPVVTQESNSLIAGFTDEEIAITDYPVILFGDHSCSFKYIDFKFVRGADGTQLIKVDTKNINLLYLYYFLLSIKIENSEKYERHFKYLKKTNISLPPKDLQDEFASYVEEIDKLKFESVKCMIAYFLSCFHSI